MTDDQRIERLTELARRAWLEKDGVVVESTPQTHGAYVLHEVSGIDTPTGLPISWTGELATIYHPRALDALEAALLVLDDQERIPLTERRVLEDRIEALERDRAALTRRYRDREFEGRAWVEELAQQWEAEIPKLEALDVPNAEGLLSKCIAELRERAGGKP